MRVVVGGRKCHTGSKKGAVAANRHSGVARKALACPVRLLQVRCSRQRCVQPTNVGQQNARYWAPILQSTEQFAGCCTTHTSSALSLSLLLKLLCLTSSHWSLQSHDQTRHQRPSNTTAATAADRLTGFLFEQRLGGRRHDPGHAQLPTTRRQANEDTQAFVVVVLLAAREEGRDLHAIKIQNYETYKRVPTESPSAGLRTKIIYSAWACWHRLWPPIGLSKTMNSRIQMTNEIKIP